MHKLRYINIAWSCIMILFGVLMLFPFFLMVTIALKTPAEIYTANMAILPQDPQWGNFIRAFGSANWSRYFLNTFFITLIGTISSVVFNSASGYAFARLNFPHKNLLFATLMLGLLVPIQAILLPLFLIIKNFPLFGGNNILGVGGIGLVDTHWALILPYMAGSFGVFLCRQYYLNFPKSLDDAATIDGCSKIRTFLSIYLPSSKPLLTSLAILKITYIWNDYAWPLVAINTDDQKTLQLGLAGMKALTVEWEILMSMAVLTMLPLMLLFIFAQRYFVQGIVTSGLKG